jgi:hypothetical protein
LHSFGVTKTQILWKKVFQKPKMAALTGFFIPAAILDFLKTLELSIGV